MGRKPTTGWNLTATPMGEPPRMNEKQFSRAKKLLRRLCANYDHGNCLLLDDGYDPCPCPQLLTYSLICKYFRAAVLPADPELHTELLGEMGLRKRCAGCGALFVPRCNRALYCDKCASQEKRRRIRERVRRFRGAT